MKAQTFKEAAASASRVGGMSDVAVSFADACVAYGEAHIKERKAWDSVLDAESTIAKVLRIDYDRHRAINAAVSEAIAALRAGNSDMPMLGAYDRALDAWSDACDAERSAEQVMMSYKDIITI